MPFLILAFTVVPITELYLLIRAGAMIGFLNTFAIVLITGIAGASLARSQGMAVLAQAQKQMSEGQVPTDVLVHGLLVFGGGLLLLTPGFMTDILGFSMVFPITRLFFVQRLKNYLLKKVKSGNVQFYSTGFGGGFRSGGPFHEGEKEPRIVKEVQVTQVRDVTPEEDN